jgi:adenylate cyclase
MPAASSSSWATARWWSSHAVDAVTCAIEIQGQLREHDAARSEANPIQFRIGINVGDIIIEGDDILGDGVNIAARIESIAAPGGISLSENTWQQVRTCPL